MLQSCSLPAIGNSPASSIDHERVNATSAGKLVGLSWGRRRWAWATTEHQCWPTGYTQHLCFLIMRMKPCSLPMLTHDLRPTRHSAPQHSVPGALELGHKHALDYLFLVTCAKRYISQLSLATPARSNAAACVRVCRKALDLKPDDDEVVAAMSVAQAVLQQTQQQKYTSPNSSIRTKS